MTELNELNELEEFGSKGLGFAFVAPTVAYVALYINLLYVVCELCLISLFLNLVRSVSAISNDKQR